MINLKKLFAAAMSLAMVTTVMPVGAVNVSVKVCTANDKAVAEAYGTVVEDLVEAIEKVTTLDEVRHDTEITWGNETVTVKDVLATTTEGSTVALSADLTKYVIACGDADIAEVAAYLVGLEDGITTLTNYVNYAYDKMYAETDTDGELNPGLLTDDQMDVILEKDYDKGGEDRLNYFVAVYDELTNTNPKTNPALATSLPYVTNLDDVTEAKYEALVEGLEEGIATLSEAYGVELSNAYVAALETYVAKYAKKVTTNVNDTKVNEYVTIIDTDELVWAAGKKGTTAALEAMIEAIEEDKAGLPGKYADNEDLDDVVAIMEGLEALLETSETLDEIVKELKDLDINGKVGSANVAEAQALYASASKNTTWDKVFSDATITELEGYVNAEDFEMLVEVMDIVAEFKTVTWEKTRNAWKQEVEWSELGKDATNMTAVFAAAGVELPKLAEFEEQYVENNVKTELTKWEALVDYIEGQVAAYETVTAGIKGITVKNLSTKNIEKVVAAKDALAVLVLPTKDVPTKGNITKAEAAKVEADYINTLYTYALFNGIATETVTGWVDLGNGNWNYYGEDGLAFTGWVAAGSDWYYVKNGAMLRNTWIAKDATGAVWYYVGNNGAMVSNTVVDGYSINANGEWVK